VGQLQIEQTGTESLTIEAEDNLLPMLTSDVTSNRLELGIKPNSSINPTRDIIYRVTVKDLGQIVVSGAGSAVAKPLTGAQFNVELTGAGNLTLEGLMFEAQVIFNIGGTGKIEVSNLQATNVAINLAGAGSLAVTAGKATDQLVRITGAGSYNAEGLVSDNVQINIAGVGNATVHANKSLDVLITGAGSVFYVGDVPQVTPTIQGTGKVIKK
jgi:Putative auto-transporter adhesin, head GIN domain